jgi:DnaJ like chaperone protein
MVSRAVTAKSGACWAPIWTMLNDLLGGLFPVALVDGCLWSAENDHLREVARHFGFDAGSYARIRAHLVGTEEAEAENPHAILGVEPGVSPEVIHLAYHRLVRGSHPDLVIAQGMPPECIALVTARGACINAACDRLAKTHAGMVFPE